MSKAKKVTVSKEVANAMKDLQARHWTFAEIMEHHSTHEWSTPIRKCLNSLSIQDMANIVYGGYEVEPSVVLPEKIDEAKVAELVGSYNVVKTSRLGSYRDGVYDGITQTLSKLNIKVKGINA